MTTSNTIQTQTKPAPLGRDRRERCAARQSAHEVGQTVIAAIQSRVQFLATADFLFLDLLPLLLDALHHACVHGLVLRR